MPRGRARISKPAIAASIPKSPNTFHISEAFEHAAEFDLIHSHYDFMALTYSRLVDTPVLTTIHGILITADHAGV